MRFLLLHVSLSCVQRTYCMYLSNQSVSVRTRKIVIDIQAVRIVQFCINANVHFNVNGQTALMQIIDMSTTVTQKSHTKFPLRTSLSTSPFLSAQ